MNLRLSRPFRTHWRQNRPRLSRFCRQCVRSLMTTKRQLLRYLLRFQITTIKLAQPRAN